AFLTWSGQKLMEFSTLPATHARAFSSCPSKDWRLLAQPFATSRRLRRSRRQFGPVKRTPRLSRRKKTSLWIFMPREGGAEREPGPPRLTMFHAMVMRWMHFMPGARRPALRQALG